MRTIHAEHVLRHALEALSGGELRRVEWDALHRTLLALARRSRECDNEDLRQGFVAHLLARPALLHALLGCGAGALLPAFRREFRRYAFEEFRATPAGRLLKALDDVLRRRGGRFARAGRLVTVRPGGEAAAFPPSLHHPGSDRFDHAAVADAAAALLARERSPHTRSELARRLAEAYGLVAPADVVHAQDEAAAIVHRIEVERAARDVFAELEPRDRQLLLDAIDGRPLREAAPRAGLRITGAHLARRRLGRRIDVLLEQHGLSVASRLPVIEAVERRLRAVAG